MQDMVNKGLAASKDLATKAGAKAKELGSKGILRLEILQLKSRVEKLTAKLGIEVYSAFVDKNQPSVSKDSPEVAKILADIEDQRRTIERKEDEYRKIGGKDDELVPTNKPE